MSTTRVLLVAVSLEGLALIGLRRGALATT